MKRLDWQGVHPPLATPFEGGEVAHRRLGENVLAYNQEPLAGYVVLGSNGEFPYLSFREKVACCRTVVEAAAGRPVVAGTGCESTAETIELTRAVAEAGADAVIVIHPSYYKGAMDDRTLGRFYTAVADASPLPVLLYNVPAYTGLNLRPAMVADLARHPNIVGLKDSSGNITQIAEIVALTRGAGDFAVLAGSAGFLLAALAVGAVGGIMALANVAPRLCWRVYEAFRQGRLEEARELQGRLIAANTAVTARFGVPGLKAAMDMAGYYGGPPRPPLLELQAPEREELQAILERAGIPGRLERGEAGNASGRAEP